MSVSQPVSGSLEQLAQPGAQDDAGKPHFPGPEQVTGPETCGKLLQLWPQLPQFWASLGTQNSPQASSPFAHRGAPGAGVEPPLPAAVLPLPAAAPDAPALPTAIGGIAALPPAPAADPALGPGVLAPDPAAVTAGICVLVSRMRKHRYESGEQCIFCGQSLSV